MKIAIISSSQYGGAGKAAYRLHLNLNKIGCHNNLFIDPDESPISSRVLNCDYSSQKLFTKTKNAYYQLKNKKNEKKRDSISNFFLKNNLSYETYSLPYSNKLIEHDNRINSSDIINLHWISGLINYPSFFDKIKKPIVWTLHDLNPFIGLFHYKNDLKTNFHKINSIDQYILNAKLKYIQKNRNIHIVCLSKEMLSESKKSKAFRQYPHYYIPNGLDSDKYNLNKNNLRARFKILNTKKIILFVAHNINNFRKGFDILLDSLKEIPDYFNLITVGGDTTTNMKNVNRIHFDKIKSETTLNELYQLADLTIVPSREDNLPNVMLESLLNGTPVMGFKVGGIKDIIKDGINGILVNKVDKDSLKEKLIEFQNNKYKFLKKEISFDAKINFSGKLQAENYLKLFNSLK